MGDPSRGRTQSKRPNRSTYCSGSVSASCQPNRARRQLERIHKDGTRILTDSTDLHGIAQPLPKNLTTRDTKPRRFTRARNVAHPCLLRVLAVKAAPKRGTAEPAAEGAGADIRPKGRVNGGASQVAQQATVRQEGGAQRPNGREIHLLAYGIGSRTLRFLAKRRRRSTTTFRERALRRPFSTGRMPTSSRPITALMRATSS